MPSVLRLVSDRFDLLSGSHRKVAQFLIDHPNDAAFYNLDATAQHAGVSTTSVIRFTRRLGFEGFKDFQKALQKEIRELKTLPERFNKAYQDIPKDQLLLHTMRNDLENISRTIQELPEESFLQAVQEIAKAPRIHIVGMRESYALAHYMLTRLLPLRKYVSLLEIGFNEMAELLMSIDREDLCIYFLFPRYTRRSVAFLSELHARGTRIILFSVPDCKEIAGMADLLLPCHIQGVSLKNSSAAPVCLINGLANAVAAYDYDSSIRYLSETSEILDRNEILF